MRNIKVDPAQNIDRRIAAAKSEGKVAGRYREIACYLGLLVIGHNVIRPDGSGGGGG